MTLGGEVAAVARRLGLTLMPWQQHVADVGLEVEDGEFVYDEIDLTVPRQSGKTAFVAAKTVHRLTVMAKRLGPQTATYTAQTRLAAGKKLERDFAEFLRNGRGFTEITNPRDRPKRATDWRLSMSSGKEHIQVGRSRWQIDAPSRTGSHGDTLDIGDIDEAFAHETDDVEQAMRPAQATRKDAQLWVFSTAGDSKSKYLWRKVKSGRQACESGEHGAVAYFEWSAPDDADPGDPAVWRACSPALGYTIDAAFLEAEWERAVRKGQEGVDLFRRAYLNQWPEIPLLDDDVSGRVFPFEDWDACADAGSQPGSAVFMAVDVTPDRAWSSIAVASRRSDGAVHVEVVDERPGTGWVADRVRALTEAHGPAGWALDPAGPAGSLLPRMNDFGIEPSLISGREMAQACGAIHDAVVSRRIRHLDQSRLNLAVAGAKRRPLGDAWAWARKDMSVNIAPLVAVTLAAWLADRDVPAEPEGELWAAWE